MDGGSHSGDESEEQFVESDDDAPGCRSARNASKINMGMFLADTARDLTVYMDCTHVGPAAAAHPRDPATSYSGHNFTERKPMAGDGTSWKTVISTQTGGTSWKTVMPLKSIQGPGIEVTPIANAKKICGTETTGA